MMETMESCVPPGFRFHPTDEELVGYYLKKKVASEKIDLDVIREIDLYGMEPWDLQERCRIGYEEQSDWYFFSHKDRKYPTGTRTNRATVAGFWKATGRDKAVFDKTKLVGMRKTLVFYQGRAPNGRKTDWIMHEYRLESDTSMGPPQEEGWVVCRAFKKRLSGGGQANKSMERWDATSYFYDEPSEVTNAVDPIDHYVNSSRPSESGNFSSHHRDFMCKRESTVSEAHTLIISRLHPDTSVQLSQLESPSLSLIQNPNSSMYLSSPQNNNTDATESEEEAVLEHINWDREAEKVTDWRALDKFVATQLCHGEEGSDGNSTVRGGEYWGRVLSSQVSDAEMEKLMSLQTSDAVEERGSRLNALVLGSGLHSDSGICIFH